MRLSTYDRWVTREPDWDDEPPPPRHCGECGSFLKAVPDRTEPWEDALECDGSARTVAEPYTEGLIAILGEEYRGLSYHISVSPCGIDLGPHAPHRDVLNAGDTEHRTCGRCGYDNLETT